MTFSKKSAVFLIRLLNFCSSWMNFKRADELGEVCASGNNAAPRKQNKSWISLEISARQLGRVLPGTWLEILGSGFQLPPHLNSQLMPWTSAVLCEIAWVAIYRFQDWSAIQSQNVGIHIGCSNWLLNLFKLKQNYIWFHLFKCVQIGCSPWYCFSSVGWL